MKKTMLGLLFGFFAIFGIASSPAFAQSQTVGSDDYWNSPVNVGSSDFTDGQGMWVGGHTDTQGSKLIDSIKSFINWTLGMLATIALVICLWAGFLMVTAAGDENKMKKGQTILKQAAIGLVIIGLAWLIVSVIFWLIGNLTD